MHTGRCPLLYGSTVVMHVSARRGYVVATGSSLAQVGVREDTEWNPIQVERALFTIYPGDSDVSRCHSRNGEEVKFGHVVRLVHRALHAPLNASDKVHAVVERSYARVSLGINTARDDDNDCVVDESAVVGELVTGKSVADEEQTAGKWRLLPRYRLRGEGERVCSGDHVVLQSMIGDQMFVHASRSVEEIADNCYEINCAPVPEGISLMAFDPYFQSLTGPRRDEVREIRCGNCVRLVHNEENFSLISDKRHRKAFLQATAMSSLEFKPNADVGEYFVVEATTRLEGGAVTCGRRDLFRLRSVGSNLYLCVREIPSTAVLQNSSLSRHQDLHLPVSRSRGGHVDAATSSQPAVCGATGSGEYELVIAPLSSASGTSAVAADEPDGTLFAFHQAGDDQSDSLKNGGRIFIEAARIYQDASAGLWLCAGTQPAFWATGSETRIGKGIATRVNLVCSPVVRVQDGFEIQRLPILEEQQILTVTYLLTPLRELPDMLDSRRITYSSVALATENLSRLAHMCFFSTRKQSLHVDSLLCFTGRGGLLGRAGGTTGSLNFAGQQLLFSLGVPQAVAQAFRSIVESPNVVLDYLLTDELLYPDDDPAIQQQAMVEASNSAGYGAGMRLYESANENAVPVQYTHLMNLLDSALGVILAVVKNQPRHAVGIGPYLQFLNTCCSYMPMALVCVTECYRNNSALLDHHTGESKALDYFFSVLSRKRRSSDVLRLLALFAQCNGEGVRPGQTKILKDLILCPARASQTLLEIRVEKSTGAVTKAPQINPHHHQTTIDTTTENDGCDADGLFLSVGIPREFFLPETRRSETADVSFMAIHRLREMLPQTVMEDGHYRLMTLLVAQVELLVAVCAGRHGVAANHVREMMPPSAVLAVATSTRTPSVLRAAFVRLFTVVHVEVEGSGTVCDATSFIRHMKRNFRTKSIFAGPRHEGHSSDMLLFTAKRFVSDFFSSHAGFGDVLSEGRSSMVSSVSRLCCALVSHGLFDRDEYISLIRILTPYIDFRCDMLGKRNAGLTFSRVADEVLTTKIQIVEIVSALADLLLAQESFRLAEGFMTREPVRSPGQLLSFEYVQDGGVGSFTPQPTPREGLDASPLSNLSVFSDLVLAEVGLSKKVQPENEAVTVQRALLEALMNATGYDHQPLRIAAFRLFSKLCNVPASLAETAKKIQLVTSTENDALFREIYSVTQRLAAEAKPPLTAGGAKTCEDDMSRLERIACTPTSGPVSEKLAVIRHAGLPDVLLSLLQSVDVPIMEPAVRLCCFSAVRLLQALCQDPLVHEKLCGNVASILHLAGDDVDVLTLVRTLYVGKPSVLSIPAVVLRDVLACVERPLLALPAVNLLIDILKCKDMSRKYIHTNQTAVWRYLTHTGPGRELIYFAGRWCGKAGRERRDRLIRDRTAYYSQSGDIEVHLASVKLVFRVSKGNETIDPETIRHELFGPPAVADILEVVCNNTLPIIFRSFYVNLLQVLVVEDEVTLGVLLHHRKLHEFLSLCLMDVMHLLLLLGGRASTQSMGEFSMDRVQAAWIRPAPQTAHERHVEELRNGVEAAVQHVALGVLPCVRRIIGKSQTSQYFGATFRASSVTRLSMAFNDVVDAAADLARFVFVLRGVADCGPFATSMIAQQKLSDFIVTCAESSKFRGSQRWEDDIEGLAKQVSRIAPPHGSVLEDDGDPKDVATGTPGAGSSSTISDWRAFIETHTTASPQGRQENVFASAAGVILRTGECGTTFLRQILSALPLLPAADQIAALQICRQAVLLQPRDRHDESSALFTMSESDLHASNIGGVMTLLTPSSERQVLMTAWNVVPLVMTTISSPDLGVRLAAVRCALALLADGNPVVLQSFFVPQAVVVAGSMGEPVFVFLRNTLAEFRERLRQSQWMETHGHDGAALLSNIETITLQLQLLQYLCEGHFTTMQLYFRYQGDAKVSVNMLECLAELLDIAAHSVTNRTIDMVNQLVLTIAETIQGPCMENQNVFVALNIAEPLMNLLLLPIRNAEESDEKKAKVPPEKLSQMQRNVLIVIRSLVEGRGDTAFLSLFCGTLDFEAMGVAMDASADAYVLHGGHLELETGGIMDPGANLADHSARLRSAALRNIFGNSGGTGDENNDALAVGADIFIIFKTILDLEFLLEMHDSPAIGGGGRGMFRDRKGLSVSAALERTRHERAINKVVGCVEILRDSRIERAYFRIPEASSKSLREATKDAVIKSVDRTSDTSKHRDFLTWCFKTLRELDYYTEMQQSPLISLIHTHSEQFDVMSLLLIFVMNIYMLVEVQAPLTIYESVPPLETARILDGMGIALIVLQCLLTMHFFFGPFRVRLENQWSEWKQREMQTALQEARNSLSSSKKNLILKEGQNQDQKDRTKMSRIAAIEEPRVTPWEYVVGSAYFTLGYGLFYQNVLYLLASILGYAQSNIWYTVQLLQITTKSQLLYNVVLAVVVNGPSLVLTLILMLVVIFIFANVAFYQFSEFLDPFEANDNRFHCNTLWNCWVMHIESVRAGGGIGDIVNHRWGDPRTGRGYDMIAFQLLFFGLVNLIFLNIIFGIIVDSFGQLREQREFVNQDQTSKCFMCGIEQNEFDKAVPGGFEHHVKNEHNMWRYLLFMHHVSKKNPTELNGQEAYVAECMLRKETSFFPLGKAMMLPATIVEGTNAEAESKAASEEILEKLNAVMTRLERLESQVSK
jgi:hypothetical protein